MSIRIIDPKPSATVEKEVICPRCGVKLAYTPNDTREEIRRDYTGDSSTYTFLDCLKCNAVITLKVV